MNRTIMELRLT